MEGVLVFCFVISLSVCFGNRFQSTFDDAKRNKELSDDVSLLNREINKLLKERKTVSEPSGTGPQIIVDDPKARSEDLYDKSILNRAGVSKILEERTTDSDGSRARCYKYEQSTAYNGTASITVSGIKCQNWNTNYPHIPYHRPDTDDDDYNSNYCRDLSGHGMPWCYTTDPGVRWENCRVDLCYVERDCYEFGKSNEYAGRRSKTISGRDCQYWYSDYTHKRYHHPDRTTELELFRSNFCLDLGNEGAPWCYTTDENVRWEYCDVPVC